MSKALKQDRCTICGARLIEGRYVRSSFTGNRYCIDTDKHQRLLRKKKKAAA